MLFDENSNFTHVTLLWLICQLPTRKQDLLGTGGMLFLIRRNIWKSQEFLRAVLETCHGRKLWTSRRTGNWEKKRNRRPEWYFLIKLGHTHILDKSTSDSQSHFLRVGGGLQVFLMHTTPYKFANTMCLWYILSCL